MKYDMETGYLLKSKKIDGTYYEFRIIEDDVIQSREGLHTSASWITFHGN